MKNDYPISMSAALDTVYNMDVSDCSNADEAVAKIYQAIGNLPTIDVAPVVRCKDCRYRGGKTCPMYFETRKHCDEVDTAYDRTADNGYCEIGRRKECD